jgi:hypothetical protein
MTRSGVGSRTDPPHEQPDFYETTRFWAAAKAYGWSNLFVTWGSGGALLSAGAVLYAYLNRDLKADGLQALGVAYISLGAALFGVVLAGLAVVATFFDRDYVKALRNARSLGPSLFGFWWVAALCVFSVLTSVALTVVAYAHSSRAVTALAATIATGLFVGALLEALALVGTVMRHGLYRAELATRDEDAGGASQ